MSHPPLPPFTAESAAEKARMAEDAWNTRDPARVVLAYTSDSVWRNRAEFIQGEAIVVRACSRLSEAASFRSLPGNFLLRGQLTNGNTMVNHW